MSVRPKGVCLGEMKKHKLLTLSNELVLACRLHVSGYLDVIQVIPFYTIYFIIYVLSLFHDAGKNYAFKAAILRRISRHLLPFSGLSFSILIQPSKAPPNNKHTRSERKKQVINCFILFSFSQSH